MVEKSPGEGGLTRAGGGDGFPPYRLIRISSSIMSSAAVMIRVAAE